MTIESNLLRTDNRNVVSSKDAPHTHTNGNVVSTKDTPHTNDCALKVDKLPKVEPSLKDEPAYTPRKLRVVTIGAGYSGLTLAHKLQHQHEDASEQIDHTIYEARSELGGTWLVNTYPGVVCDVPSHIYVCIHELFLLRAAG